MLALAVAFLVLFLAAWRLLRPRPAKLAYGRLKGLDDDDDPTQPSRAQRMLAESFEFADGTRDAAGMSEAASESVASAAAVPGPGQQQLAAPPRRNVLILFATEYGFAREVARKAAASIAATGRFRPRLLNVLDFACVDWRRETDLLLVCSTTGDGVPPNEAEEFCDALRKEPLCNAADTRGHSVREANGAADHRDDDNSGTMAGLDALPLRFAVLSLGDRAYPHFCRGGAVVEELLVKNLSCQPVVARAEINQEDWEAIIDWVSLYTRAISTAADSRGAVEGSATPDYLRSAIQRYAAEYDPSAHQGRYSRLEPCMAEVVSRKPLTRFPSVLGEFASSTEPSSETADAKLVIRVEFDLAGTNLKHSAGDAVGVIPRNDPDLVDRITLAVAASGEELVIPGGDVNVSTEELLKRRPVLFKDALLTQLDLKTVRPELIDAIGCATDVKQERLRCGQLLGREPGKSPSHALSDAGKAYAEIRDVLDVLNDFVGARLTPSELVRVLRPLTARYYSISSSPVTSLDRLAITVDVLQYTSLKRQRHGVASSYLNSRVAVCEDKVGIFISRNDNFRLPKDQTRPIVMIGPGTGIAPFIAFIEERVASSPTGRNILYFGCRHAQQDFLYQDKLETLVRAGKLELETAFSRDQPEKVYVQHRLLARAADIWTLMHVDGAHFYICGDGRRMAPDVDATLTRIVQEQGRMGIDVAAQYLDNLRVQGRMQRDVWVP